MKKKVLFIISGLTYSGAEIVLERYLDNNWTIDPYFLIIYENKDLKLLLNEKYKNIYFVNIKHNKHILRYIPLIDSIKIQKSYSTILQEIKPDVIYCNNTIESMLVGNLKKEKKIPLIMHVHDMKSSIKSPIRIYFTKKALKKANKIITVSNACKKDWNLEMTVIYNGIETEYYVSKDIKKINTIGFIGGISKRKGFDIFLDVIELLSNKQYDIKFKIAFNNIHQAMLMNRAKNITEADIEFYENLQREQVKEFYNQCDLIIVPSRQDPLPTVVMEAIARGVLVIGTKIDGIPELLNHNEELLFDNFNDIEQTLVNFLNKNSIELNQILNNLQVYIRKNFNSQNKIKQVNSIINDLIDE